MRRTVAAFMALMVVGTMLGSSTAAEAKAQPTVVVIGDSVTARYNNVSGDPLRGWWSWLGGRGKVTIVRKAQSGSGVMNPGYVGDERCAGNTFGSRTSAIGKLKTPPKAIIVEGGRNDVHDCAKAYREPADAQAAWEAYFRSLRAQAVKIKLKPKDVYVFSPWGQTDVKRAHAWRVMQKTAAEKYGLRWVKTRNLTIDEAPDGGHPNAEGSVALYRMIAKYSDLETRFR